MDMARSMKKHEKYFQQQKQIRGPIIEAFCTRITFTATNPILSTNSESDAVKAGRIIHTSSMFAVLINSSRLPRMWSSLKANLCCRRISQIDESKEEWVDNIDFSSSAPSWVWPEASRRQRQCQSLHQKGAGTGPYALTLTVTSCDQFRLHKMLTWKLGCSGATTSVAMKTHALTSLSSALVVGFIAATFWPAVKTRAPMPHA